MTLIRAGAVLRDSHSGGGCESELATRSVFVCANLGIGVGSTCWGSCDANGIGEVVTNERTRKALIAWAWIALLARPVS